MNNGKFFAGLALGALVGSALSCFAHSNRGRKLRRDVYDAIHFFHFLTYFSGYFTAYFFCFMFCMMSQVFCIFL